MTEHRLLVDFGPDLMGFDRLANARAARFRSALMNELGLEAERRRCVLFISCHDEHEQPLRERIAALLAIKREAATLRLQRELWQGEWEDLDVSRIEPGSAAASQSNEPEERTLEQRIELQRKAGWAEHVVEFRFSNRSDARTATKLFRSCKIKPVHRGSRVMIGAATPEHADELANQWRPQLPATERIEIRAAETPAARIL